MRRRLLRGPLIRALAFGLAMAMLTSCSVVSAPPSGYVIEAVFPEAVALYEQSSVKVMGFDVGVVTDIEIETSRVRVRMRIREDVPLPADVQAAIVPFTIIGERNILLHPAWQPGMARAEDGAVIPLDRTEIPVEVDDALRSFIDLAEAVEAEDVRRLLTSSAAAVAGRGQEFGQTVEDVAEMVETIDDLDQQVLSLAEDVSALAHTLNAREDQVVELIDGISDVADVVATHRENAARMLTSLANLNEQGRRLLEDYRERLPVVLARLARLGLVLRANTGTVQALVAALNAVGDAVMGAYSDETGALVLRTSVPALSDELIDGILESLLGEGAAP